MWGFSGSTKTYPIFIGCLQVSGALLLFFDRTKLVGAALFTPIFSNIILLDILYEISPRAQVNSVVYQLLFLSTIIQQRHRIWQSMENLILPASGITNLYQHLIRYFLATVIAAGIVLAFNAITERFELWRLFDFY